MASSTQCKRKFTQNTALVKSLGELTGLNPVAISALPISAVYYIAGLSITQDMSGIKFIRTLYWIGLVCFVVLAIIYAVSASKGDYKRQTACGAVLCGYAGAHCAITMFNKELRYDEVKTFSIIFFIVFVAILVGEYVYPKFSLRKNDILVGNLNKCYLELSDKGACGISYSNITASCDGAYFEVEYSDIRQARWEQVSASGKQYLQLIHRQ